MSGRVCLIPVPPCRNKLVPALNANLIADPQSTNSLRRSSGDPTHAIQSNSQCCSASPHDLTSHIRNSHVGCNNLNPPAPTSIIKRKRLH